MDEDEKATFVVLGTLMAILLFIGGCSFGGCDTVPAEKLNTMVNTRATNREELMQEAVLKGFAFYSNNVQGKALWTWKPAYDYCTITNYATNYTTITNQMIEKAE